MISLKKIIPGGQTGADQAALQAAIDVGLEHGGWCPPGRVCEDGIIPEHFNLQETSHERDPSAQDIPRSQRTIWNVRDSDGSLIFLKEGQRDKGTELALSGAKKFGKPSLIVGFDEERVGSKIQEWVKLNEIEILSVGGPSENTCPGIFKKTYLLLLPILELLK